MPHKQQSAGAAASGRWPQRRIIVVLTFLCTAICYIERTGFSVAYTAVANSAGVSQQSKGKILSAFFYGYSLSQVPGGWVAQRVGGRRVLLWSSIAWTLACLATPTDPKAWGVIVLIRVLVGVAQGFIIPSIHTVLARWVPPHERSRSVSLTTSGMYLGAALGMLYLPELVHLKGSKAVYFSDAALGLCWSLVWFLYATDPPLSEHPKASAAGFGAPSSDFELRSISVEENGSAAASAAKEKRFDSRRAGDIPWKRILQSGPVWAIVVNNFTFHYVLYVLMNWLPTYFEQGLRVGLQSMGTSKMLPYLIMFFLSNAGGWIADYCITTKLTTIGRTRKWLNTTGFLVAALGLTIMPRISTVNSALVCSSMVLGSLALARAGFAVNHLDIAPRFAGIVMGISNTAGTIAGIVGVAFTGWLLGSSDLSSWGIVFGLPSILCVLSAAFFCTHASGDRVFE